MAEQGAEAVKYSVFTENRAYCYFSQMCCYKNKIILAGKASKDFEGNENPLPLIAAFDRSSDALLWENTSFSEYDSVGAIIPNAINTFTVQLHTNSTLHYVSADLLGNER